MPVTSRVTVTRPPEIVASTPVVTADWRTTLSPLTVEGATLRELRMTDAPSLAAALAAQQVARFISTPPSSAEGFERFIAWTAREQEAGRYVCFAIVPEGREHAAGIIQLRQLEPGFGVAEWGFALDSAYWGTGLFQAAARAVIAFAFRRIGVHRLEARAMVANARGCGALRKLGATPEALLRRAFLKDGEYTDQMLWSILASEWSASTQPRVH